MIPWLRRVSFALSGILGLIAGLVCRKVWIMVPLALAGGVFFAMIVLAIERKWGK